MEHKNEDDTAIRALSSALATLSLAQSFMLEELLKLAPDAAMRVASSLDGYMKHVEEQNGANSVDAATTRVTVDMITRAVKEIHDGQ